MSMKRLKLLFQKKTCENRKDDFPDFHILSIYKFRYVIILLLSLTMNLALNAQKEISGNITDESNGEALPGVNVMVKGTTIGTITDLDGHYAIKISDDQAVLEFSYIGYLTESITVEGQSVIDISLVPDIVSMEEIVVVGYGTMKKSDVTGAIVSVSDDDLKQVKATNIMESIQGKAAGVEITRSSGETGSSTSVLIRGNRTLSGKNEPLYIIDGVQSDRGTDLNPNEIESIEILKDISSTSIYGAKGANGVIIITTKKGTEGKPKITFSTYFGINKPLGAVPYMDRNDYLKYKEDLAKFKDSDYRRNGIWPDSINVTYQPFEEEGILNGTNTNWLDLVTKTGYLKDYFLSVSGGKSGMTYNLSLDHTVEEGMVKKDVYKRYVIKGGFQVKVNDHISVGTSNILTFKKRNRMAFPEKEIRLMNPLAVPYDSLGNVIIYPTVSSNLRTPLWNFESGNYNKEETNALIFSNVFADIKIIDGLNFHSNLNVSMNTERKGENIRASESLVNVKMWISPQKSYTLTNILTYDKSFGIHHFQLTGVQEMQKNNTERYQIAGRDPQIENSFWYALNSLDASSISIDLDEKTYYSEGSQMSYLGRINYSLLGRYVFTGSIRYDGSSVLAKDNKWDYFPSASVAWNVNEESFMKNLNAISLLKLRLSYGTSGNYSVPEYSSIDRINLYPLYYEFGTSEEVQLSYRPVYAGNTLLTWEKTSSINIGLDFGILKNRISGNVDIYQASTKDILQQRVLPPHAAIPSIYDNIGETSNQGIEIMLRSVNISKKDFVWSTSLSLTYSEEKIENLASGVKKDEANGWFVGSPLKVWYDYEKIGIWQLSDSAEMAKFTENDFVYGDIKIKDQNNDSIINEEDRIVLGQKDPKWYGSLSNSFEYKGFDFSFLIVARMGQMVEDAVMNGFQVRDDYAESGFKVDYWTPDNPTNEAPRLDPSVSAVGYMPYASTLQYTDGSWIKLRDVTLGYTLPQNISSKLGISSLRLYFSIKNAAVLYSPLYKKGRYDPELAGKAYFPLPRTFATGLTVEF